MNINEKIQLEFTIEELNVIKKGLMELPFKESVNVITQLDKQVNEKLKMNDDKDETNE